MNSRILAVVAFATALGIFFFYVNPTLSGPVNDTKVGIASDDRALAAAGAFATKVAKLTKAQEDIGAENLASLFLMLPDSVNNIGLILDLNALAARSGVSISHIEVSPLAENSATSASSAATLPTGAQNLEQSLDFSLTVESSYAAFKTFLDALEKSKRLLDVQDISIQGSDTGVYTYLLKVRLYWLR